MKRWILAITAALAAAAALMAMPPGPGIAPPPALREAVASGRIDNPSQGILAEQLAKGGPAKISGSRTYPVVMGSFADLAATYSQAQFQSMLFGTGANVKSVNNYYRDMSYTAMSCTGRVDTWRSSGGTVAYFGGGTNGLTSGTTGNTYEFIRRTLARADSFVDFSLPEYDQNNDGYVDVLWVVHTGRGGEETGGSNEIWSHSSQLNTWGSGTAAYTTNDPWPGHAGQYVRINRYIIMPELTNYSGEANNMIGCGVFAHEFGHALGLPDLYDVAAAYGSGIMGEGLGLFSLMAAGSWGGNYASGARPVALDLWCRRFLGWNLPQLVTVNGTYTVNSTMAVATASGYKLARQGQDTTRQYWLVENRSRYAAGPFSSVKWDSLLRGEGLAIYHVDTTYTSGTFLSTNHVNSNSTNGSVRNRPYGVAMEETDDTCAGYHSELWYGYAGNVGETADLWNSGTQANFDSMGTAYPVSYYNGTNSTTPGTRSGVSIAGIPAASTAMTCVFNVFPTAPELTIALFQNQAFTYSLGISLVSFHPLKTPSNLDTANLTVDAGTPQRLNFTRISASTFQTSYALSQAGSYRIRIASRDSADTMILRSGERLFSVVAAKAAGGAASAMGGAVALSFPPGAVPADELWVVCETGGQPNPGALALGPAYQVGPGGRALAAPARLTLYCDPAALAGRDPARLRICRLENGRWAPIATRGATDGRAATADIVAGGVYQLCWSESFPPAVPGRDAILSASPNPFAGTTAIAYQLAAPARVRLTVYNVAGQLVRTVCDVRREAGPHRESWDGRNDRAEDLPSGVYHYRLRIGDRALTGRIVKVQ